MHGCVGAEDPVAPCDDPGKHEEVKNEIESSPGVDNPLVVLESAGEGS